jgi:hypothetical protein
VTDKIKCDRIVGNELFFCATGNTNKRTRSDTATKRF